MALRARARLGTVLRGKYRLEAVLGMGGMAIVYKATHRNHAEFAIKMLHPEISLDDELKSRFLREGYAANSVKHPNVVKIIDDDVSEDGAAFLVMELLDGVSAEDLLERCGRLPHPIASELGIQVLDVLGAAHSHGVLHRDIKPANVFVTRQGTVKLLDFGIARVRDLASSSAKITATGVSFGTPAFMSPEQARGKTREVREATDVFALGATLFTLLSGKLVHEAETSAEAMIKAATEPPRPLAQVAPDVPAPIAQVVDRALAFAPEARWPSATAMQEALTAAHRACFGEPQPADVAAFLLTVAPKRTAPVDTLAATYSGDPIVAGGTTAVPISSDRVRTRRRRGAAFAATVGVAAALVLGGIGLSVLRWSRSGDPPSAMGTSSPSTVTSSLHAPATPAPAPTVVETATAATTGTEPSAGAISVTDLPEATASHRSHAAAGKTVHHPAEPAPNCNPNYTLDSEGHKHFQPECFTQ